MARTYANVKIAIWHDDDFRRLSMPAQHLYFTLITDPDLSYAGVADWRPARIAGRAEAWLPESVEAAAAELCDAGFVFVCERTEEVLVRSYVRHDGMLKNAKLATSAANAVGAIASNDLRRIIVAELIRAKKDDPSLTAWKGGALDAVLARESVDYREVDPFGPDLAPSLGRQFGGGDDAVLAVA